MILNKLVKNNKLTISYSWSTTYCESLISLLKLPVEIFPLNSCSVISLVCKMSSVSELFTLSIRLRIREWFLTIVWSRCWIFFIKVVCLNWLTLSNLVIWSSVAVSFDFNSWIWMCVLNFKMFMIILYVIYDNLG